MAEYIIHACKNREWYVDGFLIPSMTEQGIDRDNIEIWMDANGDGCLKSCMKCFETVGSRGGGRWHMQDDVCISHDFRQMTEQYDDGIVCGFFRKAWQSFPCESGVVPGIHMWNSFQCIRIPDKIAGECAEWFYNDAMFRDVYKQWIEHNKCDDSIFYDYIMENYASSILVRNLSPNIVEHVDYLIGGSVINRFRDHYATSDLWIDVDAVEKLKEKLAHR